MIMSLEEDMKHSQKRKKDKKERRGKQHRTNRNNLSRLVVHVSYLHTLGNIY